MGGKSIKIITCNLPEQYIEIIDKLTGSNRLYPSRSELIRVAIHEYLIKELQSLDQFVKLQKLNLTTPPNIPNRENFNGISKIEKLFKILELD